MLVKLLNNNTFLPTRSYTHAAAVDIYMPQDGVVTWNSELFPLDISVAIPEGHVGILTPRSSTGALSGLCLTNTIGVIDSDYRGELGAFMYVKDKFKHLEFVKGQRLLQLLVLPVHSEVIQQVDELPETKRASGGFGSSGS